jgi:hypothetical protein
VRIEVFAVLLATTLGVAAVGVSSAPGPAPQTAQNPTTSPAPAATPAAAYMCPMHPDVMSATPGKCPRCNMDLVPVPTSAYVCPMHPDVMSATPGKCSRCNMDLVAGSPITMPDFELHVESTPRVIKPGQPTTFRFSVHHPLTGEQAKNFALMHDKLFHLFVVSRDMQDFAHVHPEPHADGSFTIRHTLPRPGHYVLFSDFLAVGGGAQVVTTPLVTADVDTDIMAAGAKLTPDAAWVKTVDGVKVEILNPPAEILGGEEVDFVFRFTNASANTPITDLERYLGAFGHMLILSEDMTEYVHAHPREETQPDPDAPTTGGPEVIFDALLPKPGRYKAWLQFQRGGTLSTVSFTFAAPRPGETTVP